MAPPGAGKREELWGERASVRGRILGAHRSSGGPEDGRIRHVQTRKTSGENVQVFGVGSLARTAGSEARANELGGPKVCIEFESN